MGEGKVGPHLTQYGQGRGLSPYQSTSFGWGKGWNVTSAGWQVTLCDPIWHVSSSSDVATSVSELLYPCYFTKWHFDPSSRLATTDNAENWGAVPLGGGGAGSPSNTVWPGLRPTSIPSCILIHPTVWPQQTWPIFRGLCPFGGGVLGPHLTQFGEGRDLPPCQLSS